MLHPLRLSSPPTLARLVEVFSLLVTAFRRANVRGTSSQYYAPGRIEKLSQRISSLLYYTK
jgi:hypothetical protein